MFLTSLELTNFRNFKKNIFNFGQGVTALVADNTKGKTSILEAVFYLATGKSSRADKDYEVIRWGENLARIKGEITNQSQILNRKSQIHISNVKSDGEAEVLEVVFADTPPASLDKLGTSASRGKRFLVNGVAKRMVDFTGLMKAVVFRPEDMDLISGSPSLRRKYLDFVLIQTDREYRRALISYEKGLRQRNGLLERIRDEGVARSQLLFWNLLLIKDGNYISDKRAEYIAYVNNQEKNLGNYEAIYDASQISEARLEQYSEAEVASGNTLVGPHRDNFLVEIKATSNKQQATRDLAIYGSRGEQRLAVLWLKLCEMAYIEEKSGERPILLLDDIFSELDHSHRDLVFETMDKQQTIVTSADPHLIEDGVEMEIIKL